MKRVSMRKLTKDDLEKGDEALAGHFGLFSGNQATGFYIEADDLDEQTNQRNAGQHDQTDRDDNEHVRSMDEGIAQFRLDHQGSHAGLFNKNKRKVGKIDAKSLRQFRKACDTVGWPQGAGD